MKVLFLAVEAAPFNKVGGLADFVAALPAALRKAGVDARVMIPRYGSMRGEDYELHKVGGTIPVPVGADQEPVHLLQATTDDVPVYFIWSDQYFSNREKVYGFNDDPQRFVFFSRAAIAALPVLDWRPDVIHANDWHVAPVAAWLDVYGRTDDFYNDIATVFTIHNATYQGVCGRLILSFGNMPKLPHLSVELPGQVNWLAQGLAHADVVSTVSATYAQTLLRGELEPTLQPLFQQRHDRLFGILGGIDYDRWDPARDAVLVQTYNVDSLKMRAVNKAAFQRELRLPIEADVPLLGLVVQLDNEREWEMTASAVEFLVQQENVQVVLLGIHDGLREEVFRDLQGRFPGNVRGLARFDDRVERRLYSSLDMFVSTGYFEPNNISLMTAMRYGAVPVVRAPGAIADTVVDADAKPQQATGFAFQECGEDALVTALRRGLAAYADKARWNVLQRRAMERDFSWSASAQAYLDVYRRAAALHGAS
ncbi:MAG TPA: glycogen/starch synthase [Anaerolineae bacterium]|nr:glycogen/starch synthase [Anaerolineae bacterium]